MTDASSNPIRVLAIDPTTNGFGFVVMEGPGRLIDLGVREVNRGDKNKNCLTLISEFIGRSAPDVLVTENVKAKGSRRCSRVKELIEAIQTLAGKRKFATRKVSRMLVKQFFRELGAFTKQEIA